jgi:N-acetylglucosamine kinase-like BadF-type ATPase
MHHVVGVDGGTTKTIALVADERGRILGAGRGGNSNWTGADVEQPMSIVVQTVRSALEQAALAGDDVSVAVCCLAGADWPEDYQRRYAVLSRSRIAQRVVVKNDAMAGWRAGTRDTFGVVVTAGTGTNTAIITPDGEEWLYGYYASYSGAVDIAQDAIDAVLRQEDGRGRSTALTPTVLESLECAHPDDVLKAIIAGQLARERVLALCPLVFEAAYGGDKVAADIIVKHGLVLAEYATASIKRFDMQDLAFDVVLAGSVYKGEGPLFIDTITQAVHRVAPRARVVRSEREPAVGSVLLAYDALGIPVSDEMVDNLEQTGPDPGFFRTAGRARASDRHQRRDVNEVQPG